jgi:hypothetical protein
MTTEYVIFFPQTARYVCLEDDRGRWHGVGEKKEATRFLSMSEAILFSMGFWGETEVLPVESVQSAKATLPAGGAFVATKHQRRKQSKICV